MQFKGEKNANNDYTEEIGKDKETTDRKKRSVVGKGKKKKKKTTSPWVSGVGGCNQFISGKDSLVATIGLLTLSKLCQRGGETYFWGARLRRNDARNR